MARKVKSEPSGWEAVKVDCKFGNGTYSVEPDDKGFFPQAAKFMQDHVRTVLRGNFRDGPAAAADAHAAYKSWVHGVVELGGTEPMPPAARRWSEFLDHWHEHYLRDPVRVIGEFGEIDGVDFSQVPKETPEQKPKQRMRMRM
jgi:hypothetical protein